MPNTPPGARTSSRRSHRVDGLAEAFESFYLDYQYIFVQFLIEHLVDAGRVFKGDYQALLVMAVLGQARLAAARNVLAPEGCVADPVAAAESTNASRIADITGIPRETVRRKLEALTELGWIEKDDQATYRLVFRDGRSVARRDLREVDQRAMQRVARLVADLEDVVERHETVLGKSR